MLVCSEVWFLYVSVLLCRYYVDETNTTDITKAEKRKLSRRRIYFFLFFYLWRIATPENNFSGYATVGNNRHRNSRLQIKTKLDYSNRTEHGHQLHSFADAAVSVTLMLFDWAPWSVKSHNIKSLEVTRPPDKIIEAFANFDKKKPCKETETWALVFFFIHPCLRAVFFVKMCGRTSYPKFQIY